MVKTIGDVLQNSHTNILCVINDPNSSVGGITHAKSLQRGDTVNMLMPGESSISKHVTFGWASSGFHCTLSQKVTL